MARSNFASDSGSNPSLVMSSRRFSLSSNRMTIFSPIQRGNRGNAEVELLDLSVLAVLDHDAAVLRQPLFADVQLGHDLDAAGDGVAQLQRRGHHRLQNAVNAEAHAQSPFVRLDVNVAGAALDRVGQNQVHQLDDGRFLGRLFQRRRGPSPVLPRPAPGPRLPRRSRSFITLVSSSTLSTSP